MECKDCGTEVVKGSYYCSGCGRPVGFSPTSVATETDEADLSEVPDPGPSQETYDSGPERAPQERRGLCSLCMGSFPETELSFVDGKPFCRDCNPMRVRRLDPPPPVSPEPESETSGPPGPPPVAAPSSPARQQYLGPDGGGGGGAGKLLLVILILVLAGGAVFAAATLFNKDRIDQLMAGVDATRQDAVLLVSKYRHGDQYRYRLEMGMNMDGTVDGPGFGPVPGLGGGGEFEMALDMGGDVTMDVLGVDDEGNGRVRVALDGFRQSAQAKVNGKSLPLPTSASASPLTGQVVEVEMDPFGELVSDPVSLGGGALNAEQLKQLYGGALNQVPRHRVKVGDTWTARESLPAGLGEANQMLSDLDASISVRYRVEGFKFFAGRDCMVISLEGQVEGLDNVGGLGMNMEIDMAMKGVVFFDAEAGLLIKSAMDIDMGMAADFGSGSMDFDGKIEIDLDLQ